MLQDDYSVFFLFFVWVFLVGIFPFSFECLYKFYYYFDLYLERGSKKASQKNVALLGC